MKIRGPAHLLLATLIGMAAALHPPAFPAALHAGESADRLESHVRLLADDSLEGRFMGTPGIEEAAHYIAGEFQVLGLEPLPDSSYLQEFAIPLGYTVTRKPVMAIGERELSHGDEFKVLPISGSARVEGLTAFITDTEGNQVYIDVPRNLKGYIVFCILDGGADRDRWTLRGRDGLLENMAGLATQVAGFGASAVVFVNGSPDSSRSDLHYFPISRAHEPVDIPVLEIPYSVLDEALMFEGVTLRAMLEEANAGRDPGVETSFFLDGPMCRLVIETAPRTVSTSNVIGVVRGRRSPDEFVIVGAHYDHLGYGDIASSTPWRREVHNGADDNASGAAALIEVARGVASADGPGRSVVFIAFTAEELGAVGSRHYRDNPAMPLESTVAMVNLDTVGRLEDNNFIVFGARSAAEFESLLTEVNAKHSLNIIPKKEIFGFSDQNAFVEAGIPSLHFFTGAYDDYHTPDDDWQNLNYDGLAAITSFSTDFVLALANAETRPTPVEGLGDRREQPSSRSGGAHLGVVPDFTHSGPGVKLKGTVPRSPAETAGLAEGDLIMAIDGEAMTELRDLMVVLSGHVPGDVVEIEVERDSRTVLIPVELGVRSSGGHQEKPE
jgi:aminopeptidase YwaD